MLRRVAVVLAVVSAVAGLGCDKELVSLPGGISGRACDTTDRQGLAGVTVQARGPATDSAPTSGSGNFAISGLDSGSYDLFVVFADGTERQLNPEGSPVEVVSNAVTTFLDAVCGDPPDVPDSGAVAGQICNRHTGELVSEANVQVIAADNSVVGEGVTDVEGNFLIEDVIEGDHVVAISAVGFSRSFPVNVKVDETTVLDLAEGSCGVPFGTGCTILGSLCDPSGDDGDKLAGATVVVVRDGADPSETVTDISDNAGEFYISALLPGTYTVTVSSRLPVVNEVFIEECVAGQETVIVGPDACADRTPIGRLQGQLCDLTGFTGFFVGDALLLQGGVERYRTTTDADGVFSFDVVTPGTYDLQLGDPAVRIYSNVVINNFQTSFVAEERCPEPADECATFTYNPDVASDGRILFVVDRSGSMNQASSDAGNLSKWDALRNTLRTVTTSLSSSVTFGLFVYPNPAQDAVRNPPANCSAGAQQVAVGGNAASINDALAGIVPRGGTPTSATLSAVLPIVSGLVSANDDRPLAVVLATDGAPNCLVNPVLAEPIAPETNFSVQVNQCTCTSNAGDPPQSNTNCASFNCLDERISTNVGPLQAIANLGVQTHVIGIPDGAGEVNAGTAAVFTTALNAMAVAGGAPLPGTTKYHDGSNTAALQSALQAITRRILACQVKVDVDLTGFTSLEVRLGDSPLPQDTTQRNGWNQTSARSIELFGSACDAATNSPLRVSVRRCARP